MRRERFPAPFPSEGRKLRRVIDLPRNGERKGRQGPQRVSLAIASFWNEIAKPSCDRIAFAATTLASPYADWNTGWENGIAGGTMLYRGSTRPLNTVLSINGRSTRYAIAWRIRTSLITFTLNTRYRICGLAPTSTFRPSAVA